MRCGFCQIQKCSECKNSPFLGLPLDDEPFSELVIRKIPSSELAWFTKDLSISGVQQKYSLVFDKDSGKLLMKNQDGQFILKPEINDFRFNHSSFSVENEHISMRLTARMKINTAVSCVIPLGGHDLGYVAKRFDYADDGKKLLMEDFGQIMGIDSTGDGKYSPTVEEMGRALDQKTGASLALKSELFRRVVANFILCNGDAHVKNYSLIQNRIEDNTMVFSPVYDVMNTAVHIPGENQSALGLVNDNREQKSNLEKKNFDILASRLGLRDKARDSTYESLLSSMEGYEVSLFRDASGIDAEVRNNFIDLINERIKMLTTI